MTTEFDHKSYPHRFYRESGSVPLGGLLVATIITLAASVLFGVIYSAISYYNPIIYVGFIVTLGFGAALGASVIYAATTGHIRSNAVRLFLGLVAATVGEYVSWVIFISALTGWQSMIFDPTVLMQLVPAIAEEGYYSLRGAPVSGTILWVQWIVEALMVYGMALLLAGTFDKVYCEKSRQWIKDEEDVIRFEADSHSFMESLVSERYNVLNDLKLLSLSAVPALRINLAVPEQYDANHYLSLDELTETETKDGVKVDSNTILNRLIIPADIAMKIRELKSKVPVDEQTESMDDAAAELA